VSKKLTTDQVPHRSGALWLLAWAAASLAMPMSIAAEPLPAPPVGGACQTSAVPTDHILTAEFARARSDTIIALFGESAGISGRLATVDGAPVPNTTLCVEEWLIGAGVDPADRIAVPRIGYARTDADGAYAYRLPAGPNREAVVVYGDRSAVSLRYLAPARPTLTVTPRRTRNKGRPIQFRGRLPGPQPGGHVLSLQAKLGDGWITFRQATTDRKGRFRATYSFRRTYNPAIYVFRAHVSHQAGYPWLAGSSREVSVFVR
jgi:hypothetical protein